MKRYIIPVGVFIFLITSAIIFFNRPKPGNYKYGTPSLINVEILGEVYFPGKYQVLENTTLNELINYAQGTKPHADMSNINLNEVLQPNYTYHIPSFNDNEENKIKYNLNEINYNILITIPGITETRAINILTYREQIGKFKSLDELLNVKGIGEVTYNKIKDYFFIR